MHRKERRAAGMTSSVALGLVLCAQSRGQSPEQAQAWEQLRQQAVAEEQANNQRLIRERASRKADPMAWVRTLDPMNAGGWEFRAVASDGSWAAYSTRHQMKRSSGLVTVWLRQEYAEPQSGGTAKYLSAVEKVQYDCVKERARPLVVIYYAGNNIQGNEQTEEADDRTAPWAAIVPGTRDEFNFLWACGGGK